MIEGSPKFTAEKVIDVTLIGRKWVWRWMSE
jgi:hypothetical protein